MLQTKKLVKAFYRSSSPSVMNLEELIFSWKGRQLVLALFASTPFFIRNSILGVNARVAQQIPKA